jgi:DNA-binding CsgD family transcriptional regulator
MLKAEAIGSLEVSEQRPPARLPAARLDPEGAYAAASQSRDPAERLLAQALQSLTWLARTALAVAFTVDERGVVDVTMMHCAPGQDRGDAAALVRRLRQLEPIDPFNPRRATACRASVMSAADVGGREAYARSMHGQRLRQHGFGPPAVLYLWRAGRLVAGVLLLRRWDSPPFDPAAVRLLRLFQPLLEDAFGLAAEPRTAPLATLSLAAELTARETEVAALVAGGSSNAGIAVALNVTEATVKAHLTRIYAKLGVRSRTQLAVVMRDAA